MDASELSFWRANSLFDKNIAIYHWLNRNSLLRFHPWRASILSRKHASVLLNIIKETDYESLVSILISNHNAELSIGSSSPVWVFWGQGFNHAPKVVDACLNSIRSNVKHRDVVELDLESATDYVEIPGWVYDKLSHGQLSLAHFSDLLRMMLLAQWGGIWIDSTCYVSSPIPGAIDGYSLYSCRRESTRANWDCISGGQWTTYFVATCKNHPIASFCSALYLDYLKEHDVLPDYLLLDYAIELARLSSRAIANELRLIPYNNQDVWWLLANADQDYSEQKWVIIAENTWLHKLTWKSRFSTNQNTMLNGIVFG